LHLDRHALRQVVQRIDPEVDDVATQNSIAAATSSTPRTE
jgi:hypothetical protein